MASACSPTFNATAAAPPPPASSVVRWTPTSWGIQAATTPLVAVYALVVLVIAATEIASLVEDAWRHALFLRGTSRSEDEHPQTPPLPQASPPPPDRRVAATPPITAPSTSITPTLRELAHAISDKWDFRFWMAVVSVFGFIGLAIIAVMANTTRVEQPACDALAKTAAIAYTVATSTYYLALLARTRRLEKLGGSTPMYRFTARVFRLDLLLLPPLMVPFDVLFFTGESLPHLVVAVLGHNDTSHSNNGVESLPGSGACVVQMHAVWLGAVYWLGNLSLTATGVYLFVAPVWELAKRPNVAAETTKALRAVVKRDLMLASVAVLAQTVSVTMFTLGAIFRAQRGPCDPYDPIWDALGVLFTSTDTLAFVVCLHLMEPSWIPRKSRAFFPRPPPPREGTRREGGGDDGGGDGENDGSDAVARALAELPPAMRHLGVLNVACWEEGRDGEQRERDLCRVDVLTAARTGLVETVLLVREVVVQAPARGWMPRKWREHAGAFVVVAGTSAMAAVVSVGLAVASATVPKAVPAPPSLPWRWCVCGCRDA